jgi:hypothetical protein
MFIAEYVLSIVAVATGKINLNIKETSIESLFSIISDNYNYIFYTIKI